MFNIFEIVSLNITKRFFVHPYSLRAFQHYQEHKGLRDFYLDKTNKLFSLMIE
jgi:hypothetical protein